MPPTAVLGEIKRFPTVAASRNSSSTFDELRGLYPSDPTSSRTSKSLHAYVDAGIGKLLSAEVKAETWRCETLGGGTG